MPNPFDDASQPTRTSDGIAHDDVRFGAPTHVGDVGRLGHYRIVKPLGHGGMGAVYLAFDDRLQRQVAFKVMLAKAAENTTARERFLREARAAARIRSDYVVNIYEADVAEGVPFIAMEFLQGTSLDALLKETGSPSLAEILRIGREMALGLNDAHELGMVHRDIKPANIWLEAKSQRVKILDFGLARTEEDQEAPAAGLAMADELAGSQHLTRTGAILGTPAYMSPEQALGRKVDHRSDLFSLGIVLYKMLTGQLPFRGESAQSTLLAIAGDDPVPPRMLNPTVPPLLDAYVLRLLHKDPAGRPKNAAEVARFLADQLVTATVVPLATLPEDTLDQDPWSRIDVEESSLAEKPRPAPVAPTQPEAKPVRMKPVDTKPPRWPLLLGLCVLAGLSVVGAVFILDRVRQPLAVLAIDYGDAPVELTIKRDGQVIHARTKERELSLPPGTYTIELADGTDRWKPVPDVVELQQDRRETVRLTANANLPGGGNTLVPPPTVIRTIGNDPVFLDDTKIPADEHFPGQPKELVAVLGSGLLRTWGPTTHMAFSPDGATLAVKGQEFSDGGIVQFWDVTSGRLRGELPRLTALSFGFWYHPNGRSLINGWQIPSVWDVSQTPPKNLFTAPNQGGYSGLIAMSADGGTVVTRWHFGVRIWKCDGTKLHSPVEVKSESAPHYRFVVSPDGKWMVGEALRFPATLRVWDITGQVPHELDPLVTKNVERAIGFTPDGKRLITVNSEAIVIWDVADAKITKRSSTTTIGTQIGNKAPALSPDGKYLTLAGTQPDGKLSVLTVWDVAGNEPKMVARRETTPYWPVAGIATWHPSGKMIALGHESGMISFWNWDGKNITPRAPQAGTLGGTSQLVYDTELKTLYVGHSYDQSVNRWRWGDNTFTPLKPVVERAWYRATTRFVSPHGSGKFFIHGSGTIWLTDSLADPPKLLDKIAPAVTDFSIEAIASSPNGKQVAYRQTGKTLGDTVVVAGLAGPTDQPRAVLEHADKPVLTTTFAPNGKRIFTYDQNRKLRYWDIAGDMPVLKYSVAGVNPHYLVVAPDGRFCVTGSPYQIWDITPDGFKLRGTPQTGSGSPLGNAAISPDGRHLAFADWNGICAVFPIPSAEEIRQLELRKETLKPLWHWNAPGPVFDVVFLPDGHLAIANANGTVYIVKLPEGPVPVALSAAEAKAVQEEAARALNVKTTMENTAKMPLTLIPAGTFLMGATANEPHRQGHEGPQHVVTISKPFWMGSTEVTVGQFRQFITETKHAMPRSGVAGGTLTPKLDLEWTNPGWKQDDTFPATCITWHDAVAFCAWLSKKEQRTYRLPTEAEWEYACRAGTQSPYYWGDDKQAFSDYAHVAPVGATGQPQSVGKLKPNPWGLYDMCGNLWEWCADRHDGKPYNPATHIDPQGPPKGDSRVARGGGWTTGVPARQLRSANRDPACPTPPEWHFNGIGFRVVCEIPTEK